MNISRTLLLSIPILVTACGTSIPEDQPNIVFILADDMSYRDLGIYGQQHIQTPVLDQLAREGVRFTQAHCGSPECAPSRGTLLTGLHTGHSTIRLNGGIRGQDHLNDEDVTMAEVLKDQGYVTGFIGKWGVGLPGTEGGRNSVCRWYCIQTGIVNRILYGDRLFLDRGNWTGSINRYLHSNRWNEIGALHEHFTDACATDRLHCYSDSRTHKTWRLV